MSNSTLDFPNPHRDYPSYNEVLLHILQANPSPGNWISLPRYPEQPRPKRGSHVWPQKVTSPPSFVRL